MRDGTAAAGRLRAALATSRAAAARLRTLVDGDAERCVRLIGALQRLPSCAVADPWAAARQLPGVAEAATNASPPGRPARRAATRAAAAPHRAQVDALARAGVPGYDAPAGATRSAHAASLDRGEPRPASNVSTRPAPWPGTATVATAATVRAADVRRSVDPTGAESAALARAMAAHRVSFDAPVPRPAEAAPQGPPGSPSTWRRPDTSSPSVDQRDHRRPAPAVGGAAAAQPGSARFVGPTNADADRGAGTAPPTLVPAADLLRGLLGAPGTPVDAAPRRVEAPEPSPRAPSRLLGSLAPAAASASPAHPAAPADATPAADASEASADALNRRLIDQAWLRGVDFT